ncbi:pre-rRNA-processing protein esf1 [Entomophthora muscae]|uniref:Pre-rRNA-processing protein esf1 n=1 Tax=Entomophthora muscae TaxID=34485 RepID=A0ACC2SXR9_9FUNG|nr:pre-rRNA-processing protein esf1 [Entomophthora muscae]
MGKRSRQKKGDVKPNAPANKLEGPVTTDPRFSKVHSDPRFLKPKFQANKVKVDSRFKAIFEDDMNFKFTAKVDKYGRKQNDTTKEDMRKFYKLEDEEKENEEDINGGLGLHKEESSSAEEELSDEEKQRQLIFARSRGEIPMGSDSDAESEHSNSTEEEYDELDEGMLLDMKEDIPLGEKTRRFAALNMDWDNIKAKDLFKVFNSLKPESGAILSVSVYPSEFGKERMEYENIHGPPKEIFENPDHNSDVSSDEETLIQEDMGDEFNQEMLRKYQLERLKYFYAVVECDSVNTAAAIYEQCDGGEFESTANFFDLRFIPDDMEFEDTPRETATEDPLDYKTANFLTSALTNSKVELTWDQDDPERIKLTQRAFSTEDIDNMNFSEMLASDSEEEGENSALREKYLSLINNPSDDDGSENEMEITFAPGLSERNPAEESEDDVPAAEPVEETTVEKYLRKQREKLQAKKAARMEKHQGDTKVVETKSSKKAKQDADRAELELVMMEDQSDARQHFDMKHVLKAEKQAGRKGKHRGKAADTELTQDGFKIDKEDPRFSALFTSHHFAIDPTNPQFKKTEAMKELLSERQKKNKQLHDQIDAQNNADNSASNQESLKKKELTNLINSVKRKAADLKPKPYKKPNRG